MRKILLVGANSAIATATARLLAPDGHALVLAARDEVAVNALRDDLRIRGTGRVEALPFDARCTDASLEFVDAAFAVMGGLDTVIVAYGSLPDQEAVAKHPERLADAIWVNFTSVACLLAAVAERFEAQGQGTIVAISSVAGDRGRAVNYVYGSAKAALNCYLSGLRQRLWRRGVFVVTVKPGFVDTPMTAHYDKNFLWSSPEAVARAIVRAIQRPRAVVYAPGYWRVVMAVIRLLPERVFLRMRF